MDNPLVSIIIPVYNTRDYLDAFCKCLLESTYQNWEAYFIDDGSSDGAYSKLQEFEAKDSRIHAIENEHSGVSTTRNIGIEKSKGKYVLFFDSDDIFEKTLIEDCVNYIKKTV